MEFFENFVSVMFFTLWVMIVITFIVVVVRIILDIFRDRSLGGIATALWLIAIILVPVLGSLVYLFARGAGMAQRDAAAASAAREAQVEYTRGLMADAVPGPATEIAAAKSLLESGAITQAEFDAIKAKALA